MLPRAEPQAANMNNVRSTPKFTGQMSSKDGRPEAAGAAAHRLNMDSAAAASCLHDRSSAAHRSSAAAATSRLRVLHPADMIRGVPSSSIRPPGSVHKSVTMVTVQQQQQQQQRYSDCRALPGQRRDRENIILPLPPATEDVVITAGGATRAHSHITDDAVFTAGVTRGAVMSHSHATDEARATAAVDRNKKISLSLAVMITPAKTFSHRNNTLMKSCFNKVIARDTHVTEKYCFFSEIKKTITVH